MKNILITSAGKRVVLVELFKKALKACNIKAMVYTTDMNPALAPAGIISDKCFKVPKVTVPEYVDILLSICIDNHIGMVIPTIDTELLILSKNKDKFSDRHISIIVSDTSLFNFAGINVIPETFCKNWEFVFLGQLINSIRFFLYLQSLMMARYPKTYLL